jgi:hypothetical protein
MSSPGCRRYSSFDAGQSAEKLLEERCTSNIWLSLNRAKGASAAMIQRKSALSSPRLPRKPRSSNSESSLRVQMTLASGQGMRAAQRTVSKRIVGLLGRA